EGTTVLRARAFKQSWGGSSIGTRTYLFLDDVVRQSPAGEVPPGWPTGSVNGQVFNFGMDPEIVDHAEYGPLMLDALKAIPSVSLVIDQKHLTSAATGIYVNATGDGAEWERPASFELLHPDGSEGFQVGAGLRIRGGFSRTPGNP